MWDWDEFALNMTSATEVERTSAQLQSWGVVWCPGMGLLGSTSMGKLVMGWWGECSAPARLQEQIMFLNPIK